MEKNKHKLKIAALGDIHVKETSEGAYQDLFSELSEKADVLVLCGDLTDHGFSHEAEILAKELQILRIPAAGVLGNHDYESGQADQVKKILRDAKIVLLDDENFELGNVGFAGVKGFGGGFEKYMLSPFGEDQTKAFAQEAVSEALKLETNLAKLKTEHKVVALHYSPIRATITGEPLEIYPFLGSSRLEETINRFGHVSAVFHGHSDFGTHEGKTAKGIPVYNVALPLMKRIFPEKPYALIEL